MIDHFKEYFAERYGQSIIHNAAGFLIYEIVPPSQFFVAEFHIGSAYRKSSHAVLELLERANEIAKAAGCNVMTALVPTNQKTVTRVLKNNLKYGFEVIGVQNRGTAIALSKRII